MTERPRDADAPRAAHAPHDFVVVGVRRALGVGVDLHRAPVLELRHRTPADVPGPGEHPVERGAVLREEPRDGTTERQELSRREPGDQRSLRLRIDGGGA